MLIFFRLFLLICKGCGPFPLLAASSVTRSLQGLTHISSLFLQRRLLVGLVLFCELRVALPSSVNFLTYYLLSLILQISADSRQGPIVFVCSCTSVWYRVVAAVGDSSGWRGLCRHGVSSNIVISVCVVVRWWFRAALTTFPPKFDFWALTAERVSLKWRTCARTTTISWLGKILLSRCRQRRTVSSASRLQRSLSELCARMHRIHHWATINTLKKTLR
jgi:hypothetical protein